jgi:hypothetical protein
LDGYIKLHRKLLENPIVCKDGEYLAIWIYLLLNATHKECDAVFKGKRITLLPGQLITGRKSIAKKFNTSESKVQRVIKKLEIEHQIEQQTSNENRLITILNWGDYQKTEQQNEQPVNNERTTSEQRVNTNKNEKNVISINKDKSPLYEKRYSFDSFEMKCVDYLIKTIKDEMPDAKLPSSDEQIDKWCDSIEKMIRIDKHTKEDVYKTLVYARTDSFWKANIRSATKLREKYDTLYSQLKNKKPQQAQPKSTNKFNDFPQRNYSDNDLNSMEQKLLERQGR